MASSRLFFALWPDDATREAVYLATRKLVRHCGGRPVPPGNFHITLAFLGGVPGPRVDAAAGCAARLAAPSFELALQQVGWFAAPGVLWLGPAAGSVELTRLTAELRLALTAAGLPPDPQPFRPHLTLARKVHAEPAVTSVPAVAWPVSGFTLMESTTAAQGVQYRSLARFQHANC